MERLGKTKLRSLNAAALRTWGLLFVAAGIIGRCILHNRILNLGDLTAIQMLEVLSATEYSMAVAAAVLLLQAAETCAIPIFALLLTEGFRHTGNRTKYLLRVAGVALLSEIPYNLAMSGTVLELTSRNPVFSLVFGMAVLYFYCHYGEKTAAHRLIRICVTVAAVLWAGMLRIDHGLAVLVMTVTFWLMREKPRFRTLVSCVVAVLCSVTSPFYMAMPMGCIPIHFYSGEPGESSRIVNYLAYPVILTVVYLVGILAF